MENKRKAIAKILKMSLASGLGIILVLFSTGCKGSALPFFEGSFLGDPTVEDGDGTRGDGTPQIRTVTKIFESTSDIPSWSAGELPFTGPRRALGVITTDSQWPFEFNFTYPPNNFSLGAVRLQMMTSRDSSDTEAIFMDGVFTGRPPASMVSSNSPRITHRHYSCVGTCSGGATPDGAPNTYFMDWALTHYKISTLNTFDLDIADLLVPTSVTVEDIMSDGVVRVATGDDAYVANDGPNSSRPILIMQGSTVSSSALSCSTSPSYNFRNTYIHNDGNSISQAAFSGEVLNPFSSWTTAYSTFRSTEFFYDPRLPQLTDYSGFILSKAEISMQIRRATTDAAALVVNGIGFDQSGFDRSQATSAVEKWSTSTLNLDYWNTIVNAIPATDTPTIVTLNLLSLFSESKIRELLLQGKLNISLAGPIARIYGQGATASRTYGSSVNGPELILEGSFTAEVCEIPDDPNSPLSGGAPVAPDCLVDFTAPAISSISSKQTTATGTTIQWLTDEPATSQVGYGIGGTGSTTSIESTPKLFHSVTLSGLSPYKYYQFIARSADACGNSKDSVINVFRTLR
jgi:hypothetical protein